MLLKADYPLLATRVMLSQGKEMHTCVGVHKIVVITVVRCVVIV